MKKGIIAGILIIVIPFLIAVNFLRKTKEPDQFIGTGAALQILENTNISFSKTYQSIADIGESWGEVFEGWTPPATNDIWEQIKSFFTYIGQIFSAFWDLIEFPVMAVVDICTNIGEVIGTFIKFVGFIPE